MRPALPLHCWGRGRDGRRCEWVVAAAGVAWFFVCLWSVEVRLTLGWMTTGLGARLLAVPFHPRSPPLPRYGCRRWPRSPCFPSPPHPHLTRNPSTDHHPPARVGNAALASRLSDRMRLLRAGDLPPRLRPRPRHLPAP